MEDFGNFGDDMLVGDGQFFQHNFDDGSEQADLIGEVDERDSVDSLIEDCPLDGDAESALASIGWGTDEDYGCFGGEDF